MSGEIVAAPYAYSRGGRDVVIEPGEVVRIRRGWGGLGPVGIFDGWGPDDTLVVDGEQLAPGDRIEPAVVEDAS